MSLVLDGPHGTITIPESVLVQVAVRAAETVDGVRVRRKRSVDVETRVVRLEVGAQRGGDTLAERGERVQIAVAEALRIASALDVSVDVAFEELT